MMLSAAEWAMVIRDDPESTLMPDDDVTWLAERIEEVQQGTIDWCVEIIQAKAEQIKQHGSLEAAQVINGSSLTILLANSDRLKGEVISRTIV